MFKVMWTPPDTGVAEVAALGLAVFESREVAETYMGLVAEGGNGKQYHIESDEPVPTNLDRIAALVSMYSFLAAVAPEPQKGVYELVAKDLEDVLNG